MLNFILGLVFSVCITAFILFTSKYHGKFSFDNNFDAIQKYHTKPTPRIGGIVIFISFLMVLLINEMLNANTLYYHNLLLSVLLVFIVGTIEDLTKVITPMFRMLIFILSTLLAIYIVKAMPAISYADFNYLNNLIFHYPIIGILLSLFCVVGLTNAYNIIDGYNGLSSTMAIFNFLGFSILAYLIHDFQIMNICLTLCGALVGFLLFNYPGGKIFLGDGGAYTIGFIIAVLSIYFIHAHIGIVSPYAVLLMSIYPITEIGFSVYRRKFLHKTKGMQPDNMHLHQLIYHRCTPYNITNRNARVMPLMLIFIIPQIILGIIFYSHTIISLFFLAIYIVCYIKTYFKIVKFRTPRLLKLRN